MPEDLVRAPRRHVREMAVGETGWIDWSDMIINLERCCYLYADAKLKPDEDGYLTTRITRTADGFEVFITAMQVTPSSPYAEMSEFFGHGSLNILKSWSLQSGSDTPFLGLLVCFLGIGRLSGRALGKLSRQLSH